MNHRLLAMLARFVAGIATLLALALGLAAAHAQQPVPTLSGRVIDQTSTLTPDQQRALDAKLAAFEAASGPQIVVLLVPSTAPEDVAAYAQRVADTWKIGRRDVGDGLLVVVAKNDRRLRIEVAKALEGAIPDLAARRIIDERMRPAFRTDDYAGGLNAGIDALMARIKGEPVSEPVGAPGVRSGALEGIDLEDLGLFVLIGVPVIASVLTGLFGRRLGTLGAAAAAGGMAWWFTASLLVAVGVGVVTLVVVGIFGIGAAARRALGGGRRGGLPHIGGWGGGGFGGGGGWSGGGGGGFSSGGGGDFGGGGASGDW